MTSLQASLMTREMLEQHQRQRLATLWNNTVRENRFYQEKFRGVTFDPRCDSMELLPLTTRQELEQDQALHPPYGARMAYRVEQYVRYHQTSGSRGAPLWQLDTADDWNWWLDGWELIFLAGKVEASDRVLFPFSFGPFIGFWSAFEAACRMGCLCLPAGGVSSVARLRMVLDHDVTVMACTPTYALHLAEVARRERLDIRASAVKKLFVAGEPGGSVPAVRKKLEDAWGARVYDHAGSTEAGPWGFECDEAPGGLHITEHEYIAEVVDPATGKVLPDGEAGELVLTNLGRMGMPLLRYRTGDRVTLTSGLCACGRSLRRAEGGVAGRIDDMFTIRGNNVFPSAVEDVMRSIAGVAEYRLIVTRSDNLQRMTLEVERDRAADGQTLLQEVEHAMQQRFHFKAELVLCEPGELPRWEMKAKRVFFDDGHP